eukprot:TRINITY_DN1643_c0_g1_i1.p1 TRINITY_DN1643_c0_g1~~TRINITY_DN1643_c0_g1_i1.p1  ORF type:complete len:244 (+),score=62.26 TRINITY_DN1643_c0_g1_i1:147-878(+)
MKLSRRLLNKMSLKEGTTYIVEPKGEHTHSIVFLHGLGDTGSGWRDIFQQVQSVYFPFCKVILPTAPIQPITINFGQSCNAWYDITSLSSRDNLDDKEGIDNSKSILYSHIEKELNVNNIPSENIIVGGFSQGGATTLYSAFQYPEKFAGVIALSSYLPFKNSFGENIHDNNKDTELFMAHGTSDSVVKLEWAQTSFEVLKNDHDIKGEFHPYHGLEHSLDMNVINDMVSFIKKMFEKENNDD